jgi:hypothetical protein
MTDIRTQLREAFIAGFQCCRSYGDNHAHFDGEQKEQRIARYLDSLVIDPQPSRQDEQQAPIFTKSGRHGVDCVKRPHVYGDFLHDESDDGTYEVDGTQYCGRCHAWMGAQIVVVGYLSATCPSVPTSREIDKE